MPLTMPKASKADCTTSLITISRGVKTPAQAAWLTDCLPEFTTAQTERKLLEFWPKIRAQYLAAFPIPGMDNNSLLQEERDKVAETVHRVHEASLILFLILYGSISYGSNIIYLYIFQQSVYWWFNNKGSDRKCRAGNTSVNVKSDLVSGLSNTAVSSNSCSIPKSDGDCEDDSSSDSEKMQKRRKSMSKGKCTHKLTEIFKQESFGA